MVIDFLILLKQELVVSVLIFLLLMLKLGKDRSNEVILNLVNVLLLLNFASGFFFGKEGAVFNGMFRSNALVIFEKNILNFAFCIISMQSYAWLKTHKHVIEFYVLLLSALLGMFFMISASNLLMFYLSLELSTIPLAAAVNFDLSKKQSSEAAFKMIISSAFSSALLLLGISFLYGISGSVDFSELAAKLIAGDALHLFAFILFLSGVAFKISAVPFHLWTADVYEGAPVAVTAYLSVVSKAAVLFVFVPVLYTVFKPLQEAWYHMLFVLSLLTIITGNLFALRQNNVKRFLAFSSIAQVGFILVGISAGSREGMASVVYFVLVYVFSNLAAFGVISLISAVTGRENIDGYKGLYKTNPMLTWVLTIALFSLAGVPPTAGFFGKFFLLFAGAAKGNYWLIVIAALNMVISFYYYLRLVKAMFMEESDTPVEKVAVPAWSRLSLYACVIGIIVAGLLGCIYDHVFSLSSGM